MSNTLSKVFIFLVGAGVGAGAAWFVAKKAYQKIAQEEIDSVIETFSNRYKTEDEKEIEELEEFEKELDDVTGDEAIRKYASLMKEEDYIKYSDKDQSKGVSNVKKPYVITPEEFGEAEGYDMESLTLYADNVLTDDLNHLIEDVDGLVGYDSLTHFGEYEEDSVFVRNDNFKTDYEILLDTRKYSDVVNTNPHRAEEE